MAAREGDGRSSYNRSLGAATIRSRTRREEMTQRLGVRLRSQAGSADSLGATTSGSSRSSALYAPNIVTYLRLALIVFGCFLVRKFTVSRPSPCYSDLFGVAESSVPPQHCRPFSVSSGLCRVLPR